MKLRIARKIAGHRYPPKARNNFPTMAHTSDTRRRAAKRLHRSHWRSQSIDDWPCTDDSRRVFRLVSDEHRRRYVLAGAGYDYTGPCVGRWGAFVVYPPDGIRTNLALRGEDWVASWEAPA